ncbi:putative phospholipid-transporting ATPase DNF3 [Metarhizium anisopliae]|nr:putative phospholipid-transporting ATPase DNF3 [Metarhizium anisopliae]
MAESEYSTTEKRPVQNTHESKLRRRKTPAIRAPSIQQLEIKLRDAASKFYQSTVVELILRRKHLSASKDGRHIPLAVEHSEPLIDTRRGHAYISNNVRTSRYTVWNFIPKQLFFQFTRVGNFYFLCVGVPQMIPGLSTTGSYTTILPLLFFILLTVAKEGYDDFRRHRLDKVENANFATVLGREDHYTGKLKPPNLLHRLNPFHIKTTAQPRPGPADEFQGIRWVPTRWSNIKVGDIVRLSRDEPIPADLVLLHSDGENGLTYIDTMALDGETNLKTKQVCHALEGCGTIQGISTSQAEFVVEDPNPELFNFDGRVTVNGKAVPLTLNDVIYRGSVMRNTTSATGIVINTGEECKVRMNSNQHPRAKKPALEKVVNMVVITLATYVVILSVGVSMGYVKWKSDYEQHAWYLDMATVPFYQIIIAFIIMFNNVVPLALYISLEIVKIGQLLLLNSDIEMYHDESDTPARCNTNTILENLGQVGYIFSDKTGTLTDNIMKFRKLSVAGTVWLHEDPTDDEEIQKPPAHSGEMSYSDRKDSVQKSGPIILEEQINDLETPISPSRASFGGRRSSSQWRSTGRPDHIQPDVNTSDLVDYLRIRPHSAFARKAKEYLLAVALCHTCLPEVKDGKIDFQASSPDELALVRAAYELGYQVTCRTAKSVTLQVPLPSGGFEKMTFEILDVIEFSSARKRMSIVVRYPDGRISIICKGADSVILPRLKLASLAMQKASEVRKSADLEHEMYRRSQQYEPRNSFGGRPSLTVRRTAGLHRGRSIDQQRSSMKRRQSFEIHKLMRLSDDRPHGGLSAPRGVSLDVSRTKLLSQSNHHQPQSVPEHLGFLEDSTIYDESEVFTKCFKHLDDFATEGLRTLLYAQKFISDHDYRAWKKRYDDASTTQLMALAEELHTGSIHSVVVIDGQTLAAVEKSNTLSKQFFAIMLLVDSVICCRASPAQKALLVRTVRSSLGKFKSNKHSGLTLAIGDGANDLAMIQASHVGIGISGKEGLQAARVADYAIAQFRYLQRLLLVHGRWNYVRTAKFILYTFWKEMFFYLPTAQYQRYNGYTGTSLYQATSLTVFNTLFTSLCTICLGIWEQDLSAETLLAVPELYVYGQRNMGLNAWKYARWMFLAAVEGVIVWYGVWAGYGWISPTARDEGLYALGTLVFTVGVLWINWKLFIFETHYKSTIVMCSFFITTWGWFAWLSFLDGVYAPGPEGPYLIRHTFTRAFGDDAVWWATVFIVLAFLGLLELVGKTIKRNMLVAGVWHWPPWKRHRLNDNVEEWDLQVWQEMEQDPKVRERLRRLANDEETMEDIEAEDVFNVEARMDG